MSRRSARALLKGDAGARSTQSAMVTKSAAVLLLITGAALLGAAMTGAMDPTAGFFGAGGAWLVGGLCAASIYLRRRRPSTTLGRGLSGLFALGIRHTSVRPARSVLSLALDRVCELRAGQRRRIQEGGLRRGQRSAFGHRRIHADGGIGRAADARSEHAGRTRRPRTRNRGSDRVERRAITRFRLRPGDETSCLTLYRPTNPRIIAPEPRFFSKPRFSFASSMANDGRGDRQPVAAPESNVRGWRDRGDRRSNDVDVRAASWRRRRLHVYSRRASRPSGCASSARWPTASCSRS